MSDGSAVLDVIREVAITGLSAFAGAWAAFLFERRRESKKYEDERYRALRYAHFATLSQYSELVSFKKKVLAPFAGKDDAWRMLNPSLAEFTTPRLNLSELGFLFETADPDLINRLTTGQQRYESIRGALAARNQCHREFQAKMAALIANGVSPAPSEDALHDVVGRDLVAHLKSATAALFEGVDETLPFLEANLNDLQEASRRSFPNRRVPEYALSPPRDRG